MLLFLLSNLFGMIFFDGCNYRFDVKDISLHHAEFNLELIVGRNNSMNVMVAEYHGMYVSIDVIRF